MIEPTKEQAEWLWEKCGLHHYPNCECIRGKDICWGESEETYGENGHWHFVLPPTDLNNLFKYEPLTAMGYVIKTHTYKREAAGIMAQCSWVIIEKDREVIVTWTAKELKDALFWAICKILKEEK